MEAATLLAELNLTAIAVSKIFTEQLLEDEQRDKRYARLIAAIAEESLMLFEFALFGWTIARLIDEQPAGETPSAMEATNLFAELNLTAIAVSKIFTEQLLEDEQREKRYALLVAAIAEESLAANGRAVPLAKRLKDVLQLIMEAMDAQTASLLLVDPNRPEDLIAAASSGLADEAVAQYVTSLESHSFASRVVAAGGEPAELSDVTADNVPVSEALRRSGIHSLLGVRLPAGRTLRGVLYIGVTQQRELTPSELRRLASLGDRLTLHLDNAQLVSELSSKIVAIQLFVDVLAHDLRGPITSAKLAATLIGSCPESSGDYLSRVVRGLDRADRMITDLLDAHRVAAGGALPLNMTDFDLIDVARDVAEDLNQQYPGRVVLRAPIQVRGRWRSPYLRRAIWNLAVNGLKYGDPIAPVQILIEPAHDRVEIAVHNWVAPISVE